MSGRRDGRPPPAGGGELVPVGPSGPVPCGPVACGPVACGPYPWLTPCWLTPCWLTLCWLASGWPGCDGASHHGTCCSCCQPAPGFQSWPGRHSGAPPAPGAVLPAGGVLLPGASTVRVSGPEAPLA